MEKQRRSAASWRNCAEDNRGGDTWRDRGNKALRARNTISLMHHCNRLAKTDLNNLYFHAGDPADFPLWINCMCCFSVVILSLWSPLPILIRASAETW